MKRLQVIPFLEQSNGIPLLDVRTPAEYAAGHIPGAVSFPLFDNAERSLIGTLYKQKGKREAIKKGLEIVGPRMVTFVSEAEALGSEHLALYCWRGGKRSESMAWLLGQYGFSTIVLQNGYKAYRGSLTAYFRQKLPLMVLSGYTGSRKTELLRLLQKAKEQVVDLEGLARHQGSSFGNQKSDGQPTTEHFQNLVYEAFRKLDTRRPIWIEDECMRIGNVSLVEGLYAQKNTSPHVFIEIDKEERVAFLLEDYGGLEPEKLIEATLAIQRKLGRQNAKQAIDAIRAGDLAKAASIVLTYYDKRYQASILKKKDRVVKHIRISMAQLDFLPEQLINLTKHAV